MALKVKNYNRANKIKNTISGRIFDTLNVLFFVFFCITVLFPVWDMLVKSFSAPRDVSYISINFWPKEFVFDSYEYVINKPLFLTAYINTIMRSIIGTAYHLFIVTIGAYVLTRVKMPGLKIISFVWLIPMFFSAGLIPTFYFYNKIGLYDTFFVYVLPTAFSMYGIIIIRNFFLQIDRELEDAAMVDGAGSLRILTSIYLPLSKPVYATITLWHVVGQWTLWFDNLAYVRSESLITLQFLLRRVRIEAEMFASDAAAFSFRQAPTNFLNATTIMAATTILIITPIICLYPFLQRYFVKGVMLGAVKG